jgi:hypothetical protein
VIDIAIYDENFTPTIYENIKVLAAAQTISAVSGLQKKPSAILLNANNKGYCRITLDKDSKSFFLGNLSKCQDDINRSNIWRIICDNMKMGLITGTEVIECFNKHIVGESEEYTLPVILAAIQWILLYKVNRNDESLDVVNFLYQTFL